MSFSLRTAINTIITPLIKTSRINPRKGIRKPVEDARNGLQIYLLPFRLKNITIIYFKNTKNQGETYIKLESLCPLGSHRH